MVFLNYFQKKLSLFTDGLCQTLDHMMDSTDRPQVDYEAETLLSRISHRLERLYNVMQCLAQTIGEQRKFLLKIVQKNHAPNVKCSCQNNAADDNTHIFRQ